MPIPNLPSFSSVRTEFNNAGMGIASNLFAYRRGGGIVPDVPYYNAIGTGAPGSQIRLSQFAGLEGSSVGLSDHGAFVQHNVFTGGFGQASTFTTLRIESDGRMLMAGSTGWSAFDQASGSIDIDGTQYWDGTQSGSTSGYVNVENWLIGGGASSYSCRATIQGGSNNPNNFTTFRYGTFGTWLSMASTHEFSVQTGTTRDTGPANIQLFLLLQLARTSDLGTILASCNITLTGSSSVTFGNPEFQ